MINVWPHDDIIVIEGQQPGKWILRRMGERAWELITWELTVPNKLIKILSHPEYRLILVPKAWKAAFPLSEVKSHAPTYYITIPPPAQHRRRVRNIAASHWPLWPA
jgi:hypothetical protein